MLAIAHGAIVQGLWVLYNTNSSMNIIRNNNLVAVTGQHSGDNRAGTTTPSEDVKDLRPEPLLRYGIDRRLVIITPWLVLGFRDLLVQSAPTALTIRGNY